MYMKALISSTSQGVTVLRLVNDEAERKGQKRKIEMVSVLHRNLRSIPKSNSVVSLSVADSASRLDPLSSRHNVRRKVSDRSKDQV